MAQTIKLRRSAVQGSVPTTTQLALGELAINTYDGKLFLKKDVSGTETVVEVGAGSGVSLSANNAFTGANTFTNTTGQIFRQTATQDGILLRGRLGGTSSLTVELVPTTLTASRTLTLPDISGTVVTTGDTGSVTGTMIANGTIVDAEIASNAAIAGTKISPNFGAQLIQSSANPGVSLTGAVSGTQTTQGVFAQGSLGFSGARVGANFADTQAQFFQVILQNKSSNANASCDFVVCNDASTDTTTYGNFGINSSAYSGSSSLSLANATYVTATTGDLVLGTTTSNQVRFVVNSGATDAFGINTSGAWLVAGSAGTSGQTYRSGGSAAAPTWSNIGTSKVVSLTATQQSGTTALANVTQLVASLEANATYTVDCFVTFRSSATTNGLVLGFTSPTGCNPMVEVVVPIVSTAAASALRITFPNAASTTSGSVTGTGVTAINSNHTARLSGIIKNGGTAGNFQIQFATEVNSQTVTLQIGSTMLLTRIA